MKKILSIIIVATVCIAAIAKDKAECRPQVKCTMKFQGQEREYFIYIPEKLGKEKALVLMLHGHGGHAENYCASILETANKYGFAVCFPQGLIEPAPKSKPAWNVGYPFQAGWKVDDCKFILALSDKLAKDYGLNRNNFFFSGMSNGGEMCYLMAHRYPDAFAAIASLAGLCMEWIYREMTPSQAVPFMEIHGTADKTSKWEGDPENKDGWGKYVSVPAAVGRMVSTNCCTHEVCDTLAVIRNLVVRHHYCGGTDGKDVYLYEIQGGTHSKGEKDIDLGEEMWAFFKKYANLK